MMVMVSVAVAGVSPKLASLIEQPVPPSQKNNVFRDIDGDGIMDQFSISLLGPVDSNYLNTVLDSVVYRWVDSSGHVSSVRVHGTEFSIDAKTQKTLTYQIANPKSLFPFLTSIDTAPFGNYGTVTMYAGQPGEEESILPVIMSDAMAPVIREASLHVAETDGGDDTMLIAFSEPVQLYSGASEKELFEFKTQGSGEIHNLQYSVISWKTNQMAELIFSKDISLDLRPSSQDSVRIRANALTDPDGNVVLSDAAFAKQGGSATRPFKIVVGDFRFKLTTVPKVTYNSADPSLQNAPPIQTVVRAFGAAVNPNQDQGLIVDIGSRNLLFSVQQALKSRMTSADSTVLIENIPVDTSKIKVRLELELYSSNGDFVTSDDVSLACGDRTFTGNCITHPKQLFLQWNFKAQNGRFIGSGAYYAQMRVVVWYDASPSVIILDQKKLEAWGVSRSSGSNAFRQ